MSYDDFGGRKQFHVTGLVTIPCVFLTVEVSVVVAGASSPCSDPYALGHILSSTLIQSVYNRAMKMARYGRRVNIHRSKKSLIP